MHLVMGGPLVREVGSGSRPPVASLAHDQLHSQHRAVHLVAWIALSCHVLCGAVLAAQEHWTAWDVSSAEEESGIAPVSLFMCTRIRAAGHAMCTAVTVDDDATGTGICTSIPVSPDALAEAGTAGHSQAGTARHSSVHVEGWRRFPLPENFGAW